MSTTQTSNFVDLYFDKPIKNIITIKRYMKVTIEGMTTDMYTYELLTLPEFTKKAA